MSPNPFLANVSILYPLKTPKNERFSCVYGIYNANIGQKWVKRFLSPFLPNVALWSLWKHHKTFGFLMFSGGAKGYIGKKRINMVKLNPPENIRKPLVRKGRKRKGLKLGRKLIKHCNASKMNVKIIGSSFSFSIDILWGHNDKWFNPYKGNISIK